MTLGPLSSGHDLGPLPSVGHVSATGPGSPGSLMRRCAAVAVDLPIAVLVVLVPLLGLDRILIDLDVPDGDARTIWRTAAGLWVLAFVLLYSPLSVSRWGGTVGKRVLGLEVVRLGDGGRLGYGAAVIRHLTNLVVTGVPVLCAANVSMITLSPNGGGIQDKAVRSAVVRRA
ncbi:RDD family protein [Streptomyces sp. NPDC059909]|uniref:RDD family protein n=1 Tax=Streptomyces sp. NPDC059909 TaxID=3346998 RepID=UPI0036557266